MNKSFMIVMFFIISAFPCFSEKTEEMVLQHGHTSVIRCISFHPDGDFFATAGGDNNVILWNLDGRIIRVIRTGSEGSYSVFFNEDGSRILTACGDGSVRCFDLYGNQILNINAHPWGARFAAFTGKSGERIVSFGNRQSTVSGVSGGEMKEWSRNGEIVSFRSLGGVGYFQTCASSGRQILMPASGSGAYTCVLFDAGKSEVDFFEYKQGELTDYLAVSGDGRFVASTVKIDSKASLRIVERQTKAQKNADASGYTIWKAVFNKDADRLYCAADKEKLSLLLEYNTATGSFSELMAMPVEAIPGCIALSPDQRYIVMGYDQNCMIFSLETKKVLNLKSSFIAASYCDVSQDNKLIAQLKIMGEKIVVNIWNSSGTLRTRFTIGDYCESICFSSDNRFIRIRTQNGYKIRGVDGRPFSEDGKSQAPVFNERIAFKNYSTPDGKYALKANSEGGSFTIRSQDGKLSKTVHAFSEGWASVAVSPDSLSIAAYRTDAMEKIYKNTLKLYTIRGDPIAAFYSGNVRCCDMNPSRRLLAAGSEDNCIRLWKYSGELAGKLEGHSGIVTDVRFTQDGRFCVSTSLDGSVKIWNLDDRSSLTLVEDGSEWIFYSEDGYFDASPGGGKLAGMTKKMRSFGIDQFAILSNRPDILQSRFYYGEKNEALNYKLQYMNRLVKLGLLPKTIKKSVLDSKILKDVKDKKSRSLIESVYRQGAGNEIPYKTAIELLGIPPFLEYVEKEIRGGSEPPDARIVASKKKGKLVSLSLNFKDPGPGLDHYNVFVNNVPVYGYSGKPVSGIEASVNDEVELSFGRNKVEVSCTNVKQVESLRDFIYADSDEDVRPSLYFIGFGVSQYKNKDLNLVYPDKDVRDLAMIFKKMNERFKEVHTFTFTNSECTVSNIAKAKELLKGATVDDTAVLFISGHGLHDRDARAEYYFVTHETEIKNLAATAAEFSVIEGILDGIKPRNKLFFIDTCESGDIDESAISAYADLAKSKGIKARTLGKSFPGQSKSRAFLQNRNRYIYNDLLRRTGALVFSSCRGGEVSFEPAKYKESENGFFTGAIIRAFMYAEADTDGDGFISSVELKHYVTNLVSERSAGLQNPTADRDNIYLSYRLPVVETRLSENMSPETMFSLFKSGLTKENTKLIAGLFNSGLDPNYRDERGMNLLMHAASAGKTGIIKLLLERGAKINERDKSGETALDRALENPDAALYLVASGALISPKMALAWEDKKMLDKLASLVEKGARIDNDHPQSGKAFVDSVKKNLSSLALFFLKAGFDANAANPEKETALYAACKAGNSEMAALLLESGADPKKAMTDGLLIKAPLTGAIDSGKAELVSLIIRKYSGEKSRTDQDTLDAGLRMSVSKLDFDTTRLLIKTGARVNHYEIGKQYSFYRRSPLTLAIQKNNPIMTELLLESGADVNYYDSPDNSPLFSVVFSDTGVEILKLLIVAGIDVNLANKDDTALMVAIRKESVDIVGLLVKAGAKITPKCLNEASYSGTTGIVSILLDGGIDIDSRDSSVGETCLITAVRYGKTEVVRLLVSRNANIELKDDWYGYTALLYACVGNSIEIVKILVEAGADVNASSKSGETALGIASKKGYGEIIKYLASRGAK